MKTNYKNLIIFSVVFAPAFFGLYPLYTQADSPAAFRAEEADVGALVARNARRGRSPAFVPDRPRPATESESALLADASRVTSAAEAAALYGSAWRGNPTPARAAELRRAFARAHPGADLSDFVVLKLADL